MWSSDARVDNQNHVGAQRKATMEKSTIGQKPQRIKIKADKSPKKRQSFSTSTIKVYNPISGHVITMTTGVDNQHHVGAQRKAPMDKSTIGQKPQRIKIKADKPQKRQYFSTKNNQGVQSHFWSCDHDHNRCGQSTSRWCTEKSPNGQKHHRTKAPKDKNQKRTKFPNEAIL